MTNETVFTNARIVLPDEVVEGTLVLRDGSIAEIETGPSRFGEDIEGDFLLPGLIELHTDHLECHYAPRPGVRWHVTAAVQAHDAQIATSGITTVFDCLRMGSDADDGFQPGEMRKLADAIEDAQQSGRLRAEHLLHLRCEVSSPDVLDHFRQLEGDPRVRLASLMDHAPGQRQFQTMEQYTLYYKTKRGLSNEAFARFVEERQSQSARYSTVHRREIAAACNRDGVTLASHDDATLDHVAEAIVQGVRVAEFPTSIEAARASHEAGLKVLMGAPNVVRGGSHSGNIAARELADAGLLDVLSSDYVPFSLLHAVFALSDGEHGMRLPDTVALVTSKPADAVRLRDRGRIAPGLRADLVRVRRSEGVPHVQSVWRGGRRVA
jgi:alpha-D-ribose 1-methylphosphonate 5-triphosphate diphosphatase